MMPSNKASLLTILVIIVSVLFSAWGYADEVNGSKLETASRQMDDIERGLRQGTDSESRSRTWMAQISDIKESSTRCLSDTEGSLAKLTQDLASLGEVVRGEPLEVTRKRADLQMEKSGQEKTLATCRLLQLRASEARERIQVLQKDLLAMRLLARGPTFGALLRDGRQLATSWFDMSAAFLVEHSGIELITLGTFVFLVALLILAAVVGVIARQRLHAWTDRQRWDKTLSSRVSLALAKTAARYIPQLLFGLTAAIFFFVLTHSLRPIPFISVLAYGLPAYFLLVSLIHLFLARLLPAQQFVDLPMEVSKALARRFKMLMLLLFLGYLLFATLLAQSLPEQAVLLVRGLFVTIFILNVMWALWLLGRMPYLARTRWLRVGLHLMLIAVLISEWLGYRNLSVYTLRAVLGTLAAFGLLLLTSRLLREVFDGLEYGRYGWHRRLRHLLALKRGEHVPGLIWLRTTLLLVLWGVFLVALLRIWGISDAAMQQIYGYIIQGFTIGSLTVIPMRILLAAAVVALLLTLSGWFRSNLERKWLIESRMERGAREAMVTISGYSGVAIAIVAALAVAGMEFSNLAIIAGALSVGIGFGLQNIVNNFVSGLILLFERPIKTGDWIVAGGTEGYVKRIRIRSTQIQTFDRADVIVPNSELISSQVTNWMLYDPRGRIRVPIGVAYGSDTGKVKDILLGVARSHPDVIPDDADFEAKVLFLAFGDSSLNFELRCYIKNIDKRLQVTSDLNFAIDAAFRANGVDIPFPQRDLHVRNWPASGSPGSPAIGDRPPSGSDDSSGGKR